MFGNLLNLWLVNSHRIIGQHCALTGNVIENENNAEDFPEGFAVDPASLEAGENEAKNAGWWVGFIVPKVLGLGLLVIDLGINRTSVAHRYIVFCAGCSLIRLARSEFPRPQEVVGRAHVSAWELEHPESYWKWYWIVHTFAHASLGAQLWAGFHFVGWKSALFIWFLTGTGVIMLAKGLLSLEIAGGLGVLLAIVSVLMLILAA
jgi:hypothetical protein